MGTTSWIHWVAVLAIVVIVFGTKKLRNLGSDLGGAVKGFKDGMKDGSVAPAAEDPAKPAAQVANQVANQAAATVDDKNTIDVQARPKS